MELRFFADQCISEQILVALSDAGHEVLRLRSHIHPASPDQEVINKAQDLEATLLSLNGDFANIVTYPPENYAGIVSLQIKNHPEVTLQVVSRLIDYSRTFSEPGNYKGKLFVIDTNRIRIRE